MRLETLDITMNNSYESMDLGCSDFRDVSAGVWHRAESAANAIQYAMLLIRKEAENTARAREEAKDLRDTLEHVRDLLLKTQSSGVTSSDNIVDMLNNLLHRKLQQSRRFNQNLTEFKKLQQKCEALESQVQLMVSVNDVPRKMKPEIKKPRFAKPLVAKRSKYNIPDKSKMVARHHSADDKTVTSANKPHLKFFIKIPPLQRPLPTPRRTITTVICDEEPSMDKDPEDASSTESIASPSPGHQGTQWMGGKGKTTYTMPRNASLEGASGSTSGRTCSLPFD
ncbi:hypothetical protein NEOLEDRAFT_523588 [Neolentinus lepideus HHB14362 ss-1]|uniref:Uncharacterized protein n=1 Tax=Neolentinus lepideus HHB14362 ss-1 TaxID=1314782 RepID=A0A165RCU1_9AGAM|nr:hypothetical protein NEOLEDRAFT_523588 [Neolentinus lepideus HHB14362 ss-1]